MAEHAGQRLDECGDRAHFELPGIGQARFECILQPHEGREHWAGGKSADGSIFSMTWIHPAPSDTKEQPHG